MKLKTFMLLFALAIATLGWGYVFFFYNWKLGIALMLILWANNITNKHTK